MEIAIISGKGGTGKSSITSAFISIAKSVVAVDCDVDASNLYLLLDPQKEKEEIFVSGHHAHVDNHKCSRCGMCMEYCKFDAIELFNDQIEINEVNCEGCYLCSYICPPLAIRMIPANKSRLYQGSFRYGKMVYGNLAPGEENSGKLINKLRTRAKEVANENNYDTIILDGPPGISCPVISTITGVDKVVIITEPTVSGLSDLKRTIDLVKGFNVQAYVIINKYDLNNEISHQIEEWCSQTGFPVVGNFPFEKQMVDAMIAKQSIIEFNNQADISELIKKTYYKIIQK